MKKLYLVETSSTFKISYVVQTEQVSVGRLQHLIDESKLSEIRQEFLGEKVVGVTDLSKDQYFNKIQEIFPDVSEYPEDVKMACVNNIDEDAEST